MKPCSCCVYEVGVIIIVRKSQTQSLHITVCHLKWTLWLRINVRDSQTIGWCIKLRYLYRPNNTYVIKRSELNIFFKTYPSPEKLLWCHRIVPILGCWAPNHLVMSLNPESPLNWPTFSGCCPLSFLGQPLVFGVLTAGLMPKGQEEFRHFGWIRQLYTIERSRKVIFLSN